MSGIPINAPFYSNAYGVPLAKLDNIPSMVWDGSIPFSVIYTNAELSTLTNAVTIVLKGTSHTIDSKGSIYNNLSQIIFTSGENQKNVIIENGATFTEMPNLSKFVNLISRSTSYICINPTNKDLWSIARGSAFLVDASVSGVKGINITSEILDGQFIIVNEYGSFGIYQESGDASAEAITVGAGSRVIFALVNFNLGETSDILNPKCIYGAGEVVIASPIGFDFYNGSDYINFTGTVINLPLCNTTQVKGAPLQLANLAALQNYETVYGLEVGQFGFAKDTGITYQLKSLSDPITFPLDWQVFNTSSTDPMTAITAASLVDLRRFADLSQLAIGKRGFTLDTKKSYTFNVISPNPATVAHVLQEINNDLVPQCTKALFFDNIAAVPINDNNYSHINIFNRYNELNSMGSGISGFINNTTGLLTGFINQFPLGEAVYTGNVITGYKIPQGMYSVEASLSCTPGNVGFPTTAKMRLMMVTDTNTLVSTTGTGATRNLTIDSGGLLFSEDDANINAGLANYIQTPNGVYQISEFFSDTQVTIIVPSTYTNESSVNATIFRDFNRLFYFDFGTITPPTRRYYAQMPLPRVTLTLDQSICCMLFFTTTENVSCGIHYAGEITMGNLTIPSMLDIDKDTINTLPTTRVTYNGNPLDDTLANINSSSIVEPLPVTSDNQTSFILSNTPSGIFGCILNGTCYTNIDTDFSVSGNTLTWLDPNGIQIKIGDSLSFAYSFSTTSVLKYLPLQISLGTTSTSSAIVPFSGPSTNATTTVVITTNFTVPANFTSLSSLIWGGFATSAAGGIYNFTIKVCYVDDGDVSSAHVTTHTYACDFTTYVSNSYVKNMFDFTSYLNGILVPGRLISISIASDLTHQVSVTNGLLTYI